MSRRRARRTPEILAQPVAQAARTPARLRLPGGPATAAVVGVLLLAGFGGGMIYDQTPLSPMPPSLFGLLAVPACLALIALATLERAVRAPASAPGRGPARWGAIGFAAFAAICCASVLVARYRWPSMVGAAIAVGALMLGSVVRNVARDRDGYDALLWAHVCAVSLVAALGLNEYLTNLRGGNPGWRVFGGFVNPDFLAGYLLLAIPAALGLFLTSRARHMTLAAGVGFVLQLLCLLFTQSRFGLAAAVFSLLVMGAVATATARAGALDALARKRALAVGVLGLIILLAGAGPVLHRMRAARAESYSAQFRVLTWKGAARMAAAHPLLGAGIASFETAYPPYAIVGFTRHGHGSLLQLLGETGVLGLGALLVGLAGACIGALRARRPDRRLLDGAIVAGILASLAHSLTDSDLHIPAIAFGFAVLCGLALAAAEDAGERPAVARSFSRYLGVPAALCLVAYAAAVSWARSQAVAGEDVLRVGDGLAAQADYRSALAATPGDVELRLRLASIEQGMGQNDDAHREYLLAIETAPIGKAFYRYARFLSTNGDIAGAVAYHEKARRAEPNNLQNLLALAAAYRSAGRPADADRVYDHLIALSDAPMGRVRPLPELVDWEFGEAYACRAESFLRAGDVAHAEPLLRRAASILGAFWRSRHRSEAELRVSPEVRSRTRERYAAVLNQWIDCLQRLGRKGEALSVEAEQKRYLQEAASDAEKE